MQRAELVNCNGKKEQRMDMTGTIIGTGACAASHVMENDDLAQFVDTSDAWITERTGIKRRHIAENETVSSLAVCAAKKALLDAKILADEIGLIIVSTMTPESIMPSTACLVQAAIGASNALCFDLNAACSGFVSAFVTARTYLESNCTLCTCHRKRGAFQCSGLARQGKLYIVRRWRRGSYIRSIKK